MPEATRVRRSKEERIAIIDSKIAKNKANIEMLETKKSIILNPAPRRRKATIKNLIALAKEKGMSEEEIARKLGIKID